MFLIRNNHKAICQSSFAPDLGTTSWETSADVGKTFFRELGITRLTDALRLTPQQLLDAQDTLKNRIFAGKDSKLFSPVADNVVVPTDSYQRMVNGKLNASALMLGTCDGEYDQMFINSDASQVKEFLIKRYKRKGITESDVDRYRAAFPALSEKEAYMSLHNDLGLRLAGELVARACCPYIPVYQYCFDLREPLTNWRAVHGAPCYYVFGTRIASSAPKMLSPQMMDAWAAFCLNGSPNFKDAPAEWKSYKDNHDVMMIGEQWRSFPGYWDQSLALLKDSFAEWGSLRSRSIC